MMWKQERPGWCPHPACRFKARSQDAICVGSLPSPEPHEDDENDSRLCMRNQADGGEVDDFQINRSDAFHLRRMLNVLYPPGEEQIEEEA